MTIAAKNELVEYMSKLPSYIKIGPVNKEENQSPEATNEWQDYIKFWFITISDFDKKGRNRSATNG